VFTSVFKYNKNHEPAGSPIGGQFASGLQDETDASQPPIQPGVPFLVYRLGKPGTESLDNRNAANAEGVAAYLKKLTDNEDGPEPAGGGGTHVNVYKVTLKNPLIATLPSPVA